MTITPRLGGGIHVALEPHEMALLLTTFGKYRVNDALDVVDVLLKQHPPQGDADK